MFRPKKKTSEPDPTIELKQRIAELEQQNTDLMAVCLQLTDSNLQIYQVFRDKLKHFPEPFRSSLEPLFRTKPHHLARLPQLLLLGEAPEATAKEFEAQVGYSPDKFKRPALSAAEMLSYRNHTFATIVQLTIRGQAPNSVAIKNYLFQDQEQVKNAEQARLNLSDVKKKK